MADESKWAEDRMLALMGDMMREAMDAESYGQWAAAQDMAGGGTGHQPRSLVDETTGLATTDGQTGGDTDAMDDGLYVITELAGKALPAAPTSVPAVAQIPSLGSVDDLLDVQSLAAMANGYYREAEEFLSRDFDQARITGWYDEGLQFLTTTETRAMGGKNNASRVGRAESGPRDAVNLNGTPYFMGAPKSSSVPAKLATPAAGDTTTSSAFDVEGVRKDFPILSRKIHGKPLIWLDNGATTQKPRQVIDRVAHFYTHENSNVHRGAHTLAAEATDAHEGARAKVGGLLGAHKPEEVVFVRGTTEGINLVANILGDKMLGPGDEILLTEVEHHANIVPWQMVARRTGARLRVAPIDDSGELIMEEFVRLLGPRTRIAAFTHVSNALGTVMPIVEMTAQAKRHGAIVVIDGAQGINHRTVDVKAIGCDFYVFSGHKLFAPTGIGAVWGRKALWEELPPWQGGGSMINTVTFDRTTYAGLPNKFEAGTGSLASAVGLGAAIDYITGLGWEALERHETDVVTHAVAGLSVIKKVRMIGMPRDRAGVISFVINGMDSREVGTLLDQEGIAVRAGHHCAQPALAHFGLETSVRPAFAFYNTRAEAEALVQAVERIARGRG